MSLSLGRRSSRAAWISCVRNEDQAFGIFQARRERVGVLHVVVPDRNLVTLELLEARKRTQRIEIIVKDCNLHAPSSQVGGEHVGLTPNVCRPSSFPFTM